MKKYLCLIGVLGILLCNTGNSYAQKVAVKTNLLYDATTTMNLGLEIGLGKKWSLDLSGNYNPWKFDDETRLRHWGGLQMFDVPQVLTNGKGDPNGSTNTIIMYLNQHLYSKNYGTAGAISVLMFLLCAVLCVIIYFTLTQEDDGLTREQRKAEKARIKAAKAAARHH